MNTSTVNATKPEVFGAGQAIIDVTEHFDEAGWQESGEGLDTGYLLQNCLEDATFDGPWSNRYVGNGYDLGLYRDAEDCYWELRLNEAQKSYNLHYLGKRDDVLKMVIEDLR